ncbi:CubicO group peptidase (beta-lactamase class C family) [Aquimarina sp. MAR_2010_214]|uniref:serine hydrolase n=1 Tax=Aquimarina sp. MAR_2010_214 TaxID=1250026 RepID=UPI000C704A5A|nr:serine hydrolase [Aquimarina sp. MAR_2010_214]PKV51544.1 CubicO group peptidase (beta-lactamase class C family) [Aquimarina sp. MAR_2010_214]
MNKFIIVILSLSIFGYSNAQKQETQPFLKYYKTIDSLMKISHERGIFNGNVLVTRNNSLVYQKSFGYTDGSEQTKLTKKSIFNIGSIAKEFNAVSIVMLIEIGKLQFDDKLSQFGLGLPAWSEKVTIKHLLNYVSGIPQIDYDNVEDEKDILEDLQLLPNLLFEPGTNYNYNNNSIFLQKRIIESVTKKTYQEFVMENIIFPLKMENVVFDPDFDYLNSVRCFDVHKINCEEVSTSKDWLWVSIDDLNKWITALHNNKLISRSSLELLLQNQYFKNKESSLGSSHDSFALHLHGGQSWQFEAAFMSEFKDDLNIILMSNNKSKGFEIIQSMHKIMKGKPFSLPKRSIYRQIRSKCHENIDLGIKSYYDLKESSLEIYDFENSNELKELGYDLLTSKKNNQSIEIFKLAVSEFPDNASLYNSLGEAYYANKQYDLALVNYKKSFELDNTNENAKKMIEKINNIPKK